MLRQWLSSFNTGKKVVPSLSIVSTGGYLFLSYHFSRAAGQSRLGKGYLLAGALSFAAISYTRVVMWGGDFGVEEEGGGDELLGGC